MYHYKPNIHLPHFPKRYVPIKCDAFIYDTVNLNFRNLASFFESRFARAEYNFVIVIVHSSIAVVGNFPLSVEMPTRVAGGVRYMRLES